jgi:prepilin peptidase CpaA
MTAAFYDIRFRRIPNWLNLSGLILGFGLNAFFFQLHGTITAGLGLLCAVAIYMPLYLLRGMGAGDVKLMAAVGSLVGPGNWLQIFVATALMGGVAAVGLAIFKKRLAGTCCNLWFLLKEFSQFRLPHRNNSELDVRSVHSLRMPHGVLIAIGSIICLLPIMPRLGM